jgi:ABC-type Fe3+-hydroxamate transport system substrate-binding protein
MNKKHLIGYSATALLALGLGAATAGSSNTTDTSATTSASSDTATPAATVTVSVPGSTATVTVPAVTKTVTIQAPAKTITAPRPAPAVAMAGDGTYEVGVDVRPGTYVSATPDSGNCYWARLTSGDGIDNIIDNSNSSGRSLVTIKASDKLFESSGCSDWTKR